MFQQGSRVPLPARCPPWPFTERAIMEQNLPDRFDILQLMRDYQPACVLGAAAELNLFTLLGDRSRTAAELAEEAAADWRAMAMLLDALTALRLLEKTGQRYATPAPLRPLLTERGAADGAAHDLAQHDLSAAMDPAGVGRQAGIARLATSEHPRRRGGSGRVHRRDAQRFRSDGRWPGGTPGRPAFPASARRWRGVGHVDAGLSPPGPARLPRSSICRTPSPRPDSVWPAASWKAV